MNKPNKVVKDGIPVTTLVHVDRSIKPTYPDLMKKVVHPELECSGLAEYDIASAASLWRHDSQKNDGVVGSRGFYDYLKDSGILKSCGNLQDALAIQKLGVAAFKKVFGKKVVYFWKSVVQDCSGIPCVPYLWVYRGKVELDWVWVINAEPVIGPAFRFTS